MSPMPPVLGTIPTVANGPYPGSRRARSTPIAPPWTPREQHIEYLDGWRGVAIGMVLLSHFFRLSYNAGRFGVDLFFVLSGFLMARILFEQRTPIAAFYRRPILANHPRPASVSGRGRGRLRGSRGLDR